MRFLAQNTIIPKTHKFPVKLNRTHCLPSSPISKNTGVLLSELLSPPTPDFHRRAVPTCHHHKPLSRRCHPLIPSLIPSLDCRSRRRSRRFHLAPSAHHATRRCRRLSLHQCCCHSPLPCHCIF